MCVVGLWSTTHTSSGGGWAATAAAGLFTCRGSYYLPRCGRGNVFVVSVCLYVCVCVCVSVLAITFEPVDTVLQNFPTND